MKGIIEKICKNCEFWLMEDYDGEYPTGLRSPIDEILVGCCRHPMVIKPTYGEGISRKMRSDGVLTCDEGGYTGELITGSMFGCVHFIKRICGTGEE